MTERQRGTQRERGNAEREGERTERLRGGGGMRKREGGR